MFLCMLAVLNLHVGTWLSAIVIALFFNKAAMKAGMSLFKLHHRTLNTAMLQR